MIDQLPTAVPQPAQSANGAGRDRKQASADKDDKTGTFEDVVSKAGQQQLRQGKDAEIDVQPQADAKARPVDPRPKAAFELSAALHGFGVAEQDQPQNQLQLKITAKDAAKGARHIAKTDGAGQTGQTSDAALAKLVEKLKHAAGQAEQAVRRGQHVSGGGELDAEQPLTASDELGLLLGLAKETDTRHGKKSTGTEKSEKADGDENEAQADGVTAKADLLRADQVAAVMDTKPAANSSASDGKSSQGDVVRLVSANGRGRPVEIEVTAVPGEAQRQTGKASNAPKSDTATVLEARRYLGFTSEPNATANATAVKADPARTEALVRGRSVESGVASVPGETQRETGKASHLDTATVLEARRYLGFTPEPNATALATAIKADPTWTEALQATERSDLGTLGNTVTAVNTLKLEMNPENLGSMVASLRLKGEELTVELRVDSAEAYQQLSADHDDIVKALQDQGFSIDKVTVQLNATDRTDTGADRDMARQGQAQRDGQAEQRDRQDSRSGRNDGQRGEPRWASSGAPADGGAGDSRYDTGRTGNIYL